MTLGTSFEEEDVQSCEDEVGVHYEGEADVQSYEEEVGEKLYNHEVELGNQMVAGLFEERYNE